MVQLGMGIWSRWWRIQVYNSDTILYLDIPGRYKYIIRLRRYKSTATSQWSGYTIWCALIRFEGLLCYGTTRYGHLVQVVENIGHVFIPWKSSIYRYIEVRTSLSRFENNFRGAQYSPPPGPNAHTELYHSIGALKSYKCTSNRIARSLCNLQLCCTEIYYNIPIYDYIYMDIHCVWWYMYVHNCTSWYIAV